MSRESTSRDPRQLISTLKTRCRELEQEVELLEQENKLLRRRLDNRRGNGADGTREARDRPQQEGRDNSSNDERFDTWEGVKTHTETLRSAASEAGIRTNDGEWRAPNLEEYSDHAEVPESTRSRRSGSGSPSSKTMGSPLSPSQFESTEPSTPSKSNPALDIGYVNRVGAEELDGLPYGLIVLDRDGRVLFYNETEERMAGFSREEVVGKNFFKDVAPCTRVQAFEGRFKKFVDGELGRVTFFDFAFHFEGGTQDVTIALSQGRKNGQVNVMLMRR